MEANNSQSNSHLSPSEISQIGEKFYFDQLKDKLEKKFNGQYLVIEVETKNYVVDPDKLKAIEKAQLKFGSKLFYIVQVGMIHRPTSNFRNIKYAWQF